MNILCFVGMYQKSINGFFFVMVGMNLVCDNNQKYEFYLYILSDPQSLLR